MAATRRAGGLLLAFAAAVVLCLCLGLAGPSFLPAPQVELQESHAATAGRFNPAVAVSAAVPVFMAAAEAEAKYGDGPRKWGVVMVPLVGLVIPAVVAAAWTVYSFDDDFVWQLVPGSKKGLAKRREWRKHPIFADIKDPMTGLINKDDFEAGLEEAWERAKPKGSTVTVQDKLKELSTQNAPHFIENKIEATEKARGLLSA